MTSALALSLFSGAGSLHLSLEPAGFEVAAVVEGDGDAGDTIEEISKRGR
jgi:site-specific DNA-cytosine methylase